MRDGAISPERGKAVFALRLRAAVALLLSFWEDRSLERRERFPVKRNHTLIKAPGNFNMRRIILSQTRAKDLTTDPQDHGIKIAVSLTIADYSASPWRIAAC